MRDYKETKVRTENAMRCDYCGADVYTCDNCKKYFQLGEIIYCSQDNNCRHICGDCLKEAK